jgi:hypothetical protein
MMTAPSNVKVVAQFYERYEGEPTPVITAERLAG